MRGGKVIKEEGQHVPGKTEGGRYREWEERESAGAPGRRARQGTMIQMRKKKEEKGKRREEAYCDGTEREREGQSPEPSSAEGDGS